MRNKTNISIAIITGVLTLVAIGVYSQPKKVNPLSHATQIAIEYQCLAQFGGEAAEKGCQCFIKEVNKAATENPSSVPTQVFRDAARSCGLVP